MKDTIYGFRIDKDFDFANNKIIWLAKSKKLSDCVGRGSTVEEAINKLAENEVKWIEAAKKDEIMLPLSGFPKRLSEGDVIELYNNPEFIYGCNDECEVYGDIVHPDEDREFKQSEVSRIWKRDGNNYILIYDNSGAFIYD